MEGRHNRPSELRPVFSGSLSKRKRELGILGSFHGFGTLLDTSLGAASLNFYVLLSGLNLIIAILLMRKLRLREIKSLPQGHTAP